jgi:hypothetical protein
MPSDLSPNVPNAREGGDSLEAIQEFPLNGHSCRGRNEGFLEVGFGEVGDVRAGLLDLRFQSVACPHQRLHPLHNRGLLREGWVEEV